MLLTGLLIVPSIMSAGLWDVLHQDEETAARVAKLSEEEQGKLRSFCDMRDQWQQHATNDLVNQAQEHQEGLVIFQGVTQASEIRVVCDLICLPPQSEISEENYAEATHREPTEAVEHHEHA